MPEDRNLINAPTGFEKKLPKDEGEIEFNKALAEIWRQQDLEPKTPVKPTGNLLRRPNIINNSTNQPSQS